MKEKIMSYLPFIFTYYTIIVLSTCTYNSLLGNSYMKNTWFFEVLAYQIIFTIFDH